MTRVMGLVLVVLATAGALGGALAACSRAPVAFSDDNQVLAGQPGPGLVAAPRPPIPDVPTPIGFEVIPERSKSGSVGGARRVHYLFQGTGTAAEAVRFFRQNLPREDWKPTSVRRGQRAEAVLRYIKGPENLTITIANKSGLDTLIIDIAPRR